MAETLRGPTEGGEPGPLRTLAVAFAVCAVCSAVVAVSVVLLRPYQLANQRAERTRSVARLVADLPGVGELVEEVGAAALEARVVELATGRDAPDVDPQALLEGGEGAGGGEPLPPGEDPAGIGRVPRHALVYELWREGAIEAVVLPVHGQGYLATIRGYLAVAGDGNTVRGIAIVEHEETPGLGAEITNEAWQRRWVGKKLRGEEGEVRIRVVQDAPPSGAPEAPYRVQGISGATKTSRGVSELVRFWVGPRGFGPYLERIRAEGGAP